MSENNQENNVSDPPPMTNIYNVPAKKEWPELVGLPAEEAEKKIKEEMEGAKTEVVPENHFVTMDYRTDRVRLFINGAGKVAHIPQIG